MKKQNPSTFFIILPILCLFVFFPSADSCASLNLSITPISGTSSISFGRISAHQEINKEVRIRITSTDGEQYQVFQRLAEPLTNSQGQTLASEAIKVYSLIGSNSSGTLYAQSPEQLSLSEQLIYSSSPAGNTDSFTVVYNASADRVTPSGSFMGRLVYTVRSTAGNSRDEVFLNIDLDSAGELEVSVEGSAFHDKVRLRYPSQQDDKNYVRISFKENRQGSVKIYQDMDALPQNEAAQELERESVQCSPSEGAAFSLEPKRILLLSSEAPEKELFVNFAFNDQVIEKQHAGIYKGRLRYTFEGQNITKDFWIDLEIEVEPTFNLELRFPPEGMNFQNILPETPPQLREIIVSVNTNLGKPYIVMQNVNSPLTNEKGVEIADKYFTQSFELIRGQGLNSLSNEFVPVKPGETPVFLSNGNGDPAEFKVWYRLQPFSEMNAGNYATSIIYSLGEK